MKKQILKYCILFSISIFLYILYVTTQIKFEDRFAYILYAEDKIINAQVSKDQQWRIQCSGELPLPMATCLQLYEDQYFKYHPGINPVSICKAVYTNLKSGKIERGGSTITMQLARIHEGNQARTYWQKSKEIFLALALEIKYSKNEILRLYAQYAPYGGNTVGYCAAARRYYNKDASALSWTEAATLSVLPNSPSKIYPGKSEQEFIRKRNFLLDKLLSNAYIDTISHRMALLEDIPKQSHVFPSLSPHLLQDFKNVSDEFNYHSTLDHSLQKSVLRIGQQYRDQYALTSGIDNMSVLVIRNDGSIAAYAANISCQSNCAKDVDILKSLRSPGSTLKPFLYGVNLERGLITRNSLLEDVPVFYNGYSPSNYDKKHRGIVSAEKALTESLNIPAVNLLQQYGTHSFLNDLERMEFTSIDKSADHYGLSLILGGGEVSPLELGKAYMNLTRVAKGENPVDLYIDQKNKTQTEKALYPISQGTAYLVLEMLKGVNRPSNEDGWQYFETKQDISWKTGTSFGLRDAWSVGSNKDYTVLVWVGNADGEGKPGLTGISKAAPVMFDIFKLLQKSPNLSLPHHALKTIYVCAESGYMPNASCTKTKSTHHPKNANHISQCKFHAFVTLDKTKTFRVYQGCEDEVVSQSKFSLPPIVNNYYKIFTGLSKALPPFKDGCKGTQQELTILHPAQRSEILLPVDIDDEKQFLIGKVLTNNSIDSLYWFVDHELLTVTSQNHETALDLEPGEHTLTVVASNGVEKTHNFTVLE